MVHVFSALNLYDFEEGVGGIFWTMVRVVLLQDMDLQATSLQVS